MSEYSSTLKCMKTKIATTVKLENDLYDEFKLQTIKKKLTLQTFVDRCVHLYTSNNKFKDIVDEFVIPTLSTTGSFGS